MDRKLQNLLFLFQLEEYDKERIKLWLAKNDIDTISQTKKKLILTNKIKLLNLLTTLLSITGLNIKKAAFLALDLLNFPDLLIKKVIIGLALIKLRLHKKIAVIAVTGSYGKTSTKEILYQILSAKYKVIKTPENYNTPLGIAKTILTNSMNADFLIAEMGAYKIGDIKHMCDLFRPKYRILTAIGPQHLERFGSIENIIKAKCEIFLAPPHYDLIVTDADNIYTPAALFNSRHSLELIPDNKNVYNTIFGKNIKVTSSGTDFTVINFDKKYSFHTKLLGDHNVKNILAAIAMAKFLIIDWESMIKSVADLNFIPHRLEIIKGANETIILDDAYNANPDSVKSALKVLKSLEAPRKIVITPGIVELGVKQYTENEKMGQEIAESADYLLIVGATNRIALKKGFLSLNPKHYDTAQYHSRVLECRDLNEATEKLKDIVIPKSVILFENDLPDQYL